MVARFPAYLRSLGLVVLACGPLAFASIDISHGAQRLHASDAQFDDTTTGAVAHPELTFAVGSQQMQTAQQLAKAHWGTDPCGGQVEIAWSGLASDINAQSSWTNPTSAYDNPTENGDCKITFNPVAEFDWPKFCTVTVHEYGHLAGRPHVNNEQDVMSPYYTEPAAECKQPAAPAATPPAAVEPPARAASVVKRVVKKKIVRKRIKKVAKTHAKRTAKKHRRTTRRAR